MDSQERFENMVGLVEAHQYEWTIWQAAERGGQKFIGIAGSMPGTDGFTMACFKTSDVPVGTELYAAVPTPERAQESAGVRLTDDQFRRIWMLETGTTEQDSPLAILDFARAVESAVLSANKEPQP